LIGEGQATLETAFNEIKPIFVSSKLLVFKGGESSGMTTLLVHAYFAAPFSSSLVIPVTIAKHPNAPFGTRVVMEIPPLYSFSITKFDFRIAKEVEVGGRRYNPISASCPYGKLRAFSQGKFEAAGQAETEVIRPCTGKG
jgi:hypothetical protein